MASTAKFWDDMAEGYAKSDIRDQRAYERKLEITRALFPQDADVLEIACGTGTTALHHAPYVRHYTATDISPKMLEIALQQARDAHVTNVSFEEVDIDEETLPENRYDAALAMSILHLVADRDAVLAKIHKTLKPGGHFVSSTICLQTMSFVFPLIISAMKLIGKAPKVVMSLTHDQLAYDILRAGFIIEDQHKMRKEKAVISVALSILFSNNPPTLIADDT